jgi:hypothetical protein
MNAYKEHVDNTHLNFGMFSRVRRIEKPLVAGKGKKAGMQRNGGIGIFFFFGDFVLVFLWWVLFLCVSGKHNK